jgi:hypothetical protein
MSSWEWNKNVIKTHTTIYVFGVVMLKQLVTDTMRHRPTLDL